MTIKPTLSAPISVFAPGQNSAQPYLGAPSVVEHLLRDLLGEVIALRGRRLLGESPDLRSEFEQLAERFQNTLYGRNADYAASPWNSPAHLGASLAGEGGVEDAVKHFAAGFIDRFVDTYLKYESRRVSDVEFQSSVDALVGSAVHTLLGLPAR